MNELLTITNLKKDFGQGFRGKNNVVHALDDINLTVYEGETLGLVGESGCGKSTLGRTVLQLIEPTSGSVQYRGQELTVLKKSQLRTMRRKMQIIFQDPYGSLNPRMSIYQTIKAPLDVFGLGSEEEKRQKAADMLEHVGLSARYLDRYPHEFSGGQRQRVGIARALILNPEFVVCDEAVSALDVSVRAQVLNLMQDLQKEFSLTYLFISHDLSVVKHISDRVAVMYLGAIVELAPKDDLYNKPTHPYTQALLSAIPIPDVGQKGRDRILLSGDVPSPFNIPSGCRFHTRCPYATERCKTECPALREIAPGHFVACHEAK